MAVQNSMIEQKGILFDDERILESSRNIEPSLPSLTETEREYAVDLIINNLMDCGIILHREVSGYRQVLRAYDDEMLCLVREYSIELKNTEKLN